MDSAELAAISLPRKRLGGGFAIDEVDDFLAQCTAALQAYEQGRAASLTADAIVIKQFRHVRFREAYDADAVDDLLDRVAVRLQEFQPRLDGPPPTPYTPSPEEVARANRLILLFKVLGGCAFAAGAVLIIMKALGSA